MAGVALRYMSVSCFVMQILHNEPSNCIPCRSAISGHPHEFHLCQFIALVIDILPQGVIQGFSQGLIQTFFKMASSSLSLKS